MAVRKIRTMGDPVLRGKSKSVDKIDDGILTLAQDMIDSINTGYQEGIGLAAPQIGVSKRVIVINLDEDIKVYINPELETIDKDIEMEEEGCLSVPHLKAEVPRKKKIRVKALNLNSEKIELEASGILARVFQHEVDHLDGVLFVDRLDKKTKRHLLFEYNSQQKQEE